VFANWLHVNTDPVKAKQSFILVNITWNSTGWKRPSSDRSAFKWVAKDSANIPGESWNFSDISGRMRRGFFENLGRRVNSFDDGGIVFFLSRDLSRGQSFIVGLYASARVFKSRRKPNGHPYNIEAPKEKCVLFPLYLEFNPKRHIPADKTFSRYFLYLSPKEARNILTDILGSVGLRSERESKALRSIAKQYFPRIEFSKNAPLEKQIEEMVEGQKTRKSGQGFRISPELRKKIETLAIKKATKYFESLGYRVKYVGDSESYDLDCSKGKNTLRVEVKGTQTEGASIVLTPNEILSAKRHATSLFILHSVKCLKVGNSLNPTGGKNYVLHPWIIKTHGKLKPLSYMYYIQSKE